jgi:hypothetical protein
MVEIRERSTTTELILIPQGVSPLCYLINKVLTVIDCFQKCDMPSTFSHTLNFIYALRDDDLA